MPNDNGVVTIKDFSFSPTSKRFKLYTADTFIFEAPPTLPIGVLEDAARMQSVASQPGMTERILSFFDKVLLPESARELRDRATKPTRFPFGADQLQPVIEWLLESYGLRPTTPSLPSSGGSTADSSTSSTAGAHSEESTPSDSRSIAS